MVCVLAVSCSAEVPGAAERRDALSVRGCC